MAVELTHRLLARIKRDFGPSADHLVDQLIDSGHQDSERVMAAIVQSQRETLTIFGKQLNSRELTGEMFLLAVTLPTKTGAIDWTPSFGRPSQSSSKVWF